MSDIKQLSKKEAIALYDSDAWKAWDDEKIVRLQLFQDRLCVPIDRFQKAMTAVLGRPVSIHEYASSNIDALIAEYFGTKPTPTMQEVIDLIPEALRIVVVTGQKGDVKP